MVLPEDPANWALPASMMPEFQSARARLIAALDANGRTRLPQVAAGAQLSYDCWVEEQEEGWQIDCIEKCKRDFYALLAQLEARPAPAAAPAPAAPPAPRQFIVFFDFDRSNITAEGARVIQQVIASYRQKAGPVSVVGHTDRSGTPQYNQGLSVRRANSVKAALVRGGIASGQSRPPVAVSPSRGSRLRTVSASRRTAAPRSASSSGSPTADGTASASAGAVFVCGHRLRLQGHRGSAPADPLGARPQFAHSGAASAGQGWPAG